MSEKKEHSPTADNHSTEATDLSRRNFIKVVGVFTLSTGAAPLLSCDTVPVVETDYPPSMGYILVDSKKCQGCLTCMIACSIVHEGCVNLSLARLQVVQNPFSAWPDDTAINQCHQCADAPCVEACPAEALFIDRDNGNIRLVDKSRCIGCGFCVQACPFEVERPVVAPDPAFDNAPKSRKCDLCQNAQFHWSEQGGGIDGVQTCVAVCPVNAIQFTTEIPNQQGNQGYDVNLRNANWGNLGYPTT